LKLISRGGHIFGELYRDSLHFIETDVVFYYPGNSIVIGKKKLLRFRFSHAGEFLVNIDWFIAKNRGIVPAEENNCLKEGL